MEANEVIQEVERHCHRRGLRLTATRKRVLQMVLAADGPVKAYDLLDKLKSEQPGAAPPTIYRALDFLLHNHFIHRLESLNAFVSCFHPDEAHHHGQFLICERCENVDEIHDDEIEQVLEGAARQNHFRPSRQVLEIYGICGDCGDDH